MKEHYGTLKMYEILILDLTRRYYGVTNFLQQLNLCIRGYFKNTSNTILNIIKSSPLL